MNDTITTAATETVYPAIVLAAPGAPLRPTMIGVLARAEAAEQTALARVAELENQLQALRSEQITDGADERLVKFWDKAGRIADHADFCDEYDRLAEAMNGTPRSRAWDVVMDVSISFRVYVSVESVTEEEASSTAEAELDETSIIDAIRSNGWDSIDISDTSAERG